MYLSANKGSIILGHPYRHLFFDLFTFCTFCKHEVPLFLLARTVFKDSTCLSTICGPLCMQCNIQRCFVHYCGPSYDSDLFTYIPGKIKRQLGGLQIDMNPTSEAGLNVNE